MRLWLLLILVVVLTLGCKEREQPSNEEGNAGPGVWADYKVWAAEGDSMATCKMQFYLGPKKRQAIPLLPPARVSVDGVALTADSAGISGVYYEYRAPLSGFPGQHVIEFKDESGRRFLDSFQFTGFEVLAIGKQGQNAYLVKMDGLQDKSRIRVALTDTAFDHEGYNEFVTVEEGELLLDERILGTLKSGPVQLHLATEEDRPLKSGLRGTISIAYSANRSFQLDR